MNVKTIVNGKGETQATHIEIPINGSGGKLGMHAVENLVSLISMFKDMSTKKEIHAQIYVIYGYATCCQLCGFMSRENMDDIMNIAKDLADNELIRVREGGNHGE